MQIEKVIARASWIPLLIVAVALLISFLLGIDLLRLFFPDFYLPHWHHNEPASSFFNAMGYIVLFGAFLVAVVGEIILIRHGYGSKKFWKHTTIWYAVFVVLTVGITILEGMNYNQLIAPPHHPSHNRHLPVSCDCTARTDAGYVYSPVGKKTMHKKQE